MVLFCARGVGLERLFRIRSGNLEIGSTFRKQERECGNRSDFSKIGASALSSTRLQEFRISPIACNLHLDSHDKLSTYKY